MPNTPPSPSVHPNSWLRQLTQLKPAHWPVGRSVRAALAICIPILAGLMIGSPATFLMMSLGALGLCMGEREGPYAPRFKKVLVVAPLGALGFFLGYLGTLPWAAVVAAMAAAAFLAAIISSYGASLSAAMLQSLLMGCIAIALPAIAPFWKPALLFLAGCGWYALLLGVEALFYRKRPFIDLVASLLDDLSALALARAQGAAEPEEISQRRAITDTLSSAYVGLLSKRYHNHAGRSAYLDWEAAVLQELDRLFAATLASKRPENLRGASIALRDMAAMVRADKGLTMPEPQGLMLNMILPRAVAAFRHTYWNHSTQDIGAASTADAQTPAAPLRARILDSLVVAPETVKWAAVLALCVGLAFATRPFNDSLHWYWTPLTVIIVFKPDLGSVFARTILRVAGTMLGVVVGALIFMLFPKGLLLVAVLALLVAALPWAAQRSYGIASTFATIIVLILLDEMTPGLENVDYGFHRLIDTLIGGTIILVFGYFLWPRTHHDQLARSFQAARQKLADYLLSLKPSGPASNHLPLPAARRGAYVALATMRAQLQNAMQEPPPAGPEAVAWFPLVTSAERLCDDISAWAAKYAVSPDQAPTIDQLAALVAGHGPQPGQALAQAEESDDPFSRFVTMIHDRVAQMGRMTEPQASEPGGHHAPGPVASV